MTQSLNIHIAYGSESGNAHTLAYQLKLKLLRFAPNLCELNDISITQLAAWTDKDVFIVISSTTGDGEAPYNANKFYRALVQHKSTLACQFAIFGLGDVKYDNFCGFSKVIEGLLLRQQATPIAKRVDADIDFEAFYEIWSDALCDYLSNEDPHNATNLKNLLLQVDPND